LIVVSSVSCIYGIGSAETYSDMTLNLKVNGIISRSDFLKKLVELQYERNDIDFKRGTFRVRGDSIDLFPAHLEDQGWRISLFGDEIESIIAFDSLTGNKMNDFESVNIFANSHYVTPRPTIERAIATIKAELKERLEYYHSIGRVLEAQRIEQRTVFDLEMMMETGSCKGIENYSRHLTGSTPGAPPPTLFQYLPKNAILFIDESHVTVPQIGGMYNGDFARKSVLKEHGFRLPSCLDNRPLKFEEWDNMRPDTIFVSATPGKYEMEHGRSSFAEQIIRPTGLIDPPCFIKPIATQVDDLLMECREKIKEGQRVLVTTLTKRMSEELSDYMQDAGIKVCYLHSDIDTMERVEIIRDLRLGKVDVLVGVNLLREGLDIPECGLVAILDADKEGFLRSETSLIQTIGRAARNINSKVILYADKITRSVQAALSETERRRKIQSEYNEKHGITPTSIQKSIHEVMQSPYEQDHYTIKTDNDYSLPKFDGKNVAEYVEKLHAKMLKAASDLEFEEAARLRNEIDKLQKNPSRDIKTPQNSARSKRKR
ncbi:MAG: excinuclease ABC subunit UvrB, partial [Pseudomonadota bacterium]